MTNLVVHMATDVLQILAEGFQQHPSLLALFRSPAQSQLAGEATHQMLALTDGHAGVGERWLLQRNKQQNGNTEKNIFPFQRVFNNAFFFNQKRKIIFSLSKKIKNGVINSKLPGFSALF